MPEEILELLQKGEYGNAVTALMNGRQLPTPEIQAINQQYDPKLHDVMDPAKRPNKKVITDPTSDHYGEVRNINVYAEEQGEGFRIEPVARIALAIQKLIVKRAVAFTFGNDVTYSSEPDNDSEKMLQQAINRVLHDVKERTLNRRVARSLFSTTEVAEYWYLTGEANGEKNANYGFPTPFKLRCAIFSPMFGDTLYPYFDDNRDLVAFSRYFTKKGTDGKTHAYFETYTADAYYLWTGDGDKDSKSAQNWEIVEGYPKVNTIGKIPVIYAAQPQTEWADVQQLIDRLETLLSNFADTNDYHASPKIFVEGRVIGFCRKGEAGGVIEGEAGSKASYLSWNNAPDSVKLEIDTLLRMIYTITQTPDISFETMKGIGSVSGVALKLLFMDAHLKVQDKTEIFAEYLQRRANVLKAYMKKMNQEKSFASACDSLIIEPEIKPYIIEDELNQINILTAANGGKQIASRRATIQRLGWADDAEEEERAIEGEEQRSMSYIQGEPTYDE
jgi:SPP1 family phage portal protein